MPCHRCPPAPPKMRLGLIRLRMSRADVGESNAHHLRVRFIPMFTRLPTHRHRQIAFIAKLLPSLLLDQLTPPYSAALRSPLLTAWKCSSKNTGPIDSGILAMVALYRLWSASSASRHCNTARARRGPYNLRVEAVSWLAPLP